MMERAKSASNREVASLHSLQHKVQWPATNCKQHGRRNLPTLASVYYYYYYDYY